VVLDAWNGESVARINVQAQGDFLGLNVETLSEEFHEEPDHVDVRIREANGVPAFAALRPVQETARHVKRVALPCPGSAFLLVLKAFATRPVPPVSRAPRDVFGVLRTCRAAKILELLVGS
jgi:hypothetical protein